MKRIFVAVALAGTASACQPSKPDGPDKLKAVIVAYFDCITRKDFAGMRSLVTDDFIVFENGKVINNEELIAIVQGSPVARVDYSFDGFRINVDDSSGSVIYFNHGKFMRNDASPAERDWLESATFKKVGGEWKLDFIHSTVKK